MTAPFFLEGKVEVGRLRRLRWCNVAIISLRNAENGLYGKNLETDGGERRKGGAPERLQEQESIRLGNETKHEGQTKQHNNQRLAWERKQS